MSPTPSHSPYQAYRNTDLLWLGQIPIHWDAFVFPGMSYPVRGEKAGQVGQVAYEINFNRYFYAHQPPRDLEKIEAEIKTLDKEILEMLREVTE